MSNVTSYAVMWDDGGSPSVGRLEVIDDHVVLTGGSNGHPQLIEFDTSDVEDVHVVTPPRERLAGRPTLAIALADARLLRVGALSGFGVLSEITAALIA